MGMSNPQDELIDEVVELREQRSALTNRIIQLEQELEWAEEARDSAENERDYYESESYSNERAYEDLKASVVDALVDLTNVPLSKLVQSINDIITAVEGDVLA